MGKKSDFVVFLVDDDRMYLKAAHAQMRMQKGVEVMTFASGEECLRNIPLKPDLVFLDYSLDGEDAKAKNGIQILRKIKAVDDSIHVVMLSGQAKLEVAVEALRNGAHDYVMKNEDAHLRMQNVTKNLMASAELERRLRRQKRMNLALIAVFAAIVAGSFLIEKLLN